MTDPEAESTNHEEIWQTLMTMSQGELQERSMSETDQTLRGWYSLAALSKPTSNGNRPRSMPGVPSGQATQQIGAFLTTCNYCAT